MNSESLYRTELKKFERQLISAALESHQWNRAQTARYLGMSYRGLLYRIEKLGLFSPNERARIERNAERFGITTAATSTGDGGPAGRDALNSRAS